MSTKTRRLKKGRSETKCTAQQSLRHIKKSETKIMWRSRRQRNMGSYSDEKNLSVVTFRCQATYDFEIWVETSVK